MKIRALVAFAGAVTMAPGEVLECSDRVVVDDLVSCGYVELVEDESTELDAVNLGDAVTMDKKAVKKKAVKQRCG